MNVSGYIHVDPDEQGGRVYYSDAHRHEPQTQSALAALLRTYPHAVFEAVHLDKLRELQSSTRDNPASRAEKSEQQAQIIRFFRIAKERQASDIHLLIGAQGITLVQLRIHGDLETIAQLEVDEGMQLAATIIMSMCDVTEKSFNPNRAQDGRIRKAFLQGIGLFGARYAHTPAEFGLYAVMRVLPDESHALPTLEQLGFLPEQQALIERMLARPEGVIIISGPTGSGKSTSLRSFSEMYLQKTAHRKRLLTLEDPPEGLIGGAVQTPIIADKTDPEAVSQAWVRSISASLRLDPDAMIIGEIRDTHSVKSALSAAKSGHLVQTTLHANDAVGILDRLTDTLGIPIGQVADPQLMIGLIAQRLVQLLCPHCKRRWQEVAPQLTDAQRQLLQRYCDVTTLAFRHHPGCEHCHQGVRGRKVIAEVIRPDARFMWLFRHQSKLAARSYWVHKLGGITRGAHLLRYLQAGWVDPLEADYISPLDEDALTLLPYDEVPDEKA